MVWFFGFFLSSASLECVQNTVIIGVDIFNHILLFPLIHNPNILLIFYSRLKWHKDQMAGSRKSFVSCLDLFLHFDRPVTMSILLLLCIYFEVFKRKMLIYANINKVFHTIVVITLSILNFSILHKSLAYG